MFPFSDHSEEATFSPRPIPLQFGYSPFFCADIVSQAQHPETVTSPP